MFVAQRNVDFTQSPSFFHVSTSSDTKRAAIYRVSHKSTSNVGVGGLKKYLFQQGTTRCHCEIVLLVVCDDQERHRTAEFPSDAA